MNLHDFHGGGGLRGVPCSFNLDLVEALGFWIRWLWNHGVRARCELKRVRCPRGFVFRKLLRYRGEHLFRNDDDADLRVCRTVQKSVM